MDFAPVLERCTDCRAICLCLQGHECTCSVLDGFTGDMLCHECADIRETSDLNVT